MRGRKIHTGILSHTFSESHSLSLFAFVFLCHSSKHTEAPLGDLKCHLMFASVDFLSGPELYASKTEQESLSVPTEQHFFPPTYGTYHTLGKDGWFTQSGLLRATAKAKASSINVCSLRCLRGASASCLPEKLCQRGPGPVWS